MLGVLKAMLKRSFFSLGSIVGLAVVVATFLFRRCFGVLLLLLVRGAWPGSAFLTLLLRLLRRLIHSIQNPEVMFGVLEICLCRDAVTTAGRISSKLEIFLKKLLCRSAHPHFRSIAVEHMIAV